VRALEDDLKLTDQAMSYDGSATKRSTVEVRSNPLASGSPSRRSSSGWPERKDGSPDFDSMTTAQRSEYHAARLTRVFGG